MVARSEKPVTRELADNISTVVGSDECQFAEGMTEVETDKST